MVKIWIGPVLALCMYRVAKLTPIDAFVENVLGPHMWGV